MNSAGMEKGKNHPPLASTWIDFAIVGVCRSLMELPLKLSLLAAIVSAAAAPAKCMMDQNLLTYYIRMIRRVLQKAC